MFSRNEHNPLLIQFPGPPTYVQLIKLWTKVHQTRSRVKRKKVGRRERETERERQRERYA